MKRLFFSLLFTIIVFTGSSQYSKIIIQLTNKANNSFSLTNPSQFLSPRALARRASQKLTPDSSDLPVSPAYRDSIRLAGNVTILSSSKWLNQLLIQTTDQQAMAKIMSFPFVRSAKGVGFRQSGSRISTRTRNPEEIQLIKDNQGTAARTTGDVLNYGNSYAQVHIHQGEFLHNKGYRGENMQITVLDAGFSSFKTVTAFDSLRLNGQVLGEKDFVAFDNSVNEDDSHGTFCLSTMTANWPGRMVGTSPKAKYWLVRTENVNGEYPIEEYNWVVGAEFADSTGSDMISSSLGYYDFDDPSFNHTYAEFYRNLTPVTIGAAMAARKGIIVMNSAGNEGTNSWKYLTFPADADSVCAVGAVSATGQIAGFSSYGYPGKIKPNIVSVGAGTIISGLGNQPVSGSGTSYANPNVAGLVACLWQAFPTLGNMKILDAVYRSADRYTTPTDRFGFGIPNFRKAYLTLKGEQNMTLYGTGEFFASPDPFTSQVDVRVIGQVDGNARVEILNSANQVLVAKTLVTELQEVYNFSFLNLDYLPGGTYTARYSDSLTSQTIQLHKLSTPLDRDWLIVGPNPFSNNLVITLRAPESGVASLVLFDAKGSRVDELNIIASSGQVQTLTFKNVAALQRGMYTLTYISNETKRSIALIKH